MASYALIILVIQTIIFGTAIPGNGKDRVVSRLVAALLWTSLQLPIFLRAMGFI